MRKFLTALSFLLFVTRASSQCVVDYNFTTNGFTVAFTSISSSQGTITGYYWDFGDGAVSTVANPVYHFSFPGVYAVRHSIQTTAGCTDTVVRLVMISPPAIVHISLCPPAATDSLETNTSGAIYQWQVSTDSVTYTDLAAGTNYAGTTTPKLKLINIPSSFTDYRYRCLVGGSPDQTIYRLRFVNEWTGASGSSWSNPANWSCGTLPDANTDVVIQSGNVVVDVNTTIRSLTILPGASITVQSGVTLTVLR